MATSSSQFHQSMDAGGAVLVVRFLKVEILAISRFSVRFRTAQQSGDYYLHPPRLLYHRNFRRAELVVLAVGFDPFRIFAQRPFCASHLPTPAVVKQFVQVASDHFISSIARHPQ